MNVLVTDWLTFWIGGYLSSWTDCRALLTVWLTGLVWSNAALIVVEWSTCNMWSSAPTTKSLFCLSVAPLSFSSREKFKTPEFACPERVISEFMKNCYAFGTSRSVRDHFQKWTLMKSDENTYFGWILPSVIKLFGSTLFEAICEQGSRNVSYSSSIQGQYNVLGWSEKIYLIKSGRWHPSDRVILILYTMRYSLFCPHILSKHSDSSH